MPLIRFASAVVSSPPSASRKSERDDVDSVLLVSCASSLEMYFGSVQTFSITWNEPSSSEINRVSRWVLYAIPDAGCSADESTEVFCVCRKKVLSPDQARVDDAKRNR
jgi:hypothetical protein